MPSKDAWGIEVGANAIKAVRLERSGNSAALADFEVIPFKKILTTPDLNVDEAIRVGLDELLTKQRFGKSNVVVSLPGHAVLARSAKLPPVEPKRIGDIVRFEAVQQIPFPIEQVEWDYQTFQAPDSPDVEVGIFAVTKQRLTPWLQNFQAVGMPINGIAPSLAAVYNALSYDRDLPEESGGTVLMDIGTQSTDLIICEGHRFWPRTIPIGGNHFTQALVKSFKLSFSKAEKLKREASTSKYARQIFQAMRPVFVDLVQEVQKSLGYYQSLNRDADLQRLVGMGSTFRLPGLQTFLKQQLQIEIQRLDEFKKIEAGGKDVSTFGDNVISLAPAYGLALQGLDLERVSCNLLPGPMVRRQLWHAKRPWFAAAAIVMLAATLLAYGNLWRKQAAYNAPSNTRARAEVQSVISQARAAEGQWDDAQLANDPRDRIANVNGMLAYRQLWGWIMRDLDRALMSLDPQQAILEGDVSAMRNLARRQRRVFYIDSIQATYLYGAGNQGQTDQPRDDEIDWDQAPPRYRLRIDGTTPFVPMNNRFESTEDFITKTFIASLGELSDAVGRPYRTATWRSGPNEGQPRARIELSDSVRPDAETPTRSAPRSTSPFGAAAPGVGGPATEETPEAPGLKPLPGEQPRAGDQRIVIEWVIELKQPDATTAPTADLEVGDQQAGAEREAPRSVAEDQS